LCDELARIVEKTYVSQDQFESVYIQLSKAERRLYCLLNEHETARASEIRRLVSIGNISQVATRINQKLMRVQDNRRIVSERATVTDEYGQTGIESFWSMTDSGKGVESEQSAL
jgi:DNA repair exonuclease SbcCD ATPase subunit